MSRTMIVADLGALFFALTFAEFSGPGLGLGRPDAGVLPLLLAFVFTLPGWVLAARLYGLYNRAGERADHSTIDEAVAVFHLVTVCVWLLFVVMKATALAEPAPRRLFVFWIVAMGLLLGARSIARALSRRHPIYIQNTVIAGSDDVGRLIAEKIARHPEYGLNVVGFVDSGPDPELVDELVPSYLGTLEQLPAIVGSLKVDRVIVAFADDGRDVQLQLLRELRDLDVHVDVVPRFFELVTSADQMHTIEGLPLVGLSPLRLSRSARIVKRAFDVCASALGLLVLAPVFAAIAIAIKRDSSGPVLFRQRRMGAHGETFDIFKFRTMVVDAEQLKASVAHLNKHADDGDARMFKIEDDPRVTRIGRILRRYSLDELPQLINVLRGTMSLVGPRPLILEENEHVDGWAKRRLYLQPGITGLWQVLGRDDIPFREMLHLDYRYVTSWSLGTDAKLLLKTLPKLVYSSRAN